MSKKPVGWRREHSRHVAAGKGMKTGAMKTGVTNPGSAGPVAMGWRRLHREAKSIDDSWVHKETRKISRGMPGSMYAEGLRETGGEGVYETEEAAQFEAHGLREQHVPGEMVYVSTTDGGFWEVITELE